MSFICFVVTLFFPSWSACAQDRDPFIYMETALNSEAVQWADQHTQRTENTLRADPRYAVTESNLREVFYSPSLLPKIEVHQGLIYNFWQDKAHPHGIYRRTTFASFKSSKPKWDVLFDLDELSAAEKVNWVWKGANCFDPKFERCLFSLSPGGTDAAAVREFDLTTKKFVANGFTLPANKSDVDWIDENTLIVDTDFGPGSLTKSGYGRIVKRWRRGQDLGQAVTLLEATTDDLGVNGFTILDGAQRTPFIQKNLDMTHREVYQVLPSGELKLMAVPTDANLSFGAGGFVFVLIKSDWTIAGKTYPPGTLLSWRLTDVGQGEPEVLFRPSEKVFLEATQTMDHMLYVSVLNNVQGELYRYTHGNQGWVAKKINVPAMGAITLDISSHEEEKFVLRYQNFLTPSTYYTVDSRSGIPKALKSAPAFFDSSKYMIEQFESTSTDGTQIPYFVIHAKNWQRDSLNPTLLYAYGGFERSQTPFYSSVFGREWLDKGGVFVLANIRGGGEFGPAWHTSVLKQNRHKVFEDFIGVAEDLIRARITSPAKLGIEGGSNGGLLVGTTFVMRPDLFRAVVCEVPLLDMIRYTQIGAGASWQSEYGDPADPDIRRAILSYSPYQNVKSGVSYPKVLFTTSRTDDRVGPAHARKMAARLESLGVPFMFYEDSEGGHSGDDNLEEAIHSQSLTFTYLYQQLM